MREVRKGLVPEGQLIVARQFTGGLRCTKITVPRRGHLTWRQIPAVGKRIHPSSFSSFSCMERPLHRNRCRTPTSQVLSIACFRQNCVAI